VFLLFKEERGGQVINGGLVTTVVTSFIDLGLRDRGEGPTPPTVNGVEPVAAAAVQPVPVGSRVALGTYQKLFEAPLLLEIREFYLLESSEFIQNPANTVTDYITRVTDRFRLKSIHLFK
jgi:hypothetical protein